MRESKYKLDVEVVTIWLLKSYVSLGYGITKIKVWVKMLSNTSILKIVDWKKKSQYLRFTTIKFRIFKSNLLFRIL